MFFTWECAAKEFLHFPFMIKQFITGRPSLFLGFTHRIGRLNQISFRVNINVLLAVPQSQNSTKSFTLLLTGRRLYLSSKKLNHVWLQSAITSPLFGPFNLMNGPFTQTTYVWDFKVEIKKGCFLFKHVSLILAVSSWSLTPVSIRYTYHLFVYSSWPPSAELNCNIASYCSSRSTVYKRK